MRTPKRHLYQIVVDDIREKIRRRDYLPGDQIDSLRQLRERYGVSTITAVRAVEELQTAGLAVKLQGRGVFVQGVDAPEGLGRRIRKVVCVAKANDLEGDQGNFYTRMLNGVVERTAELGIGCSFEAIPLCATAGGVVKLPFALSEGEGAVVFQQQNAALVAGLLALSAPCVAVDCFIQGLPCVLTDNHAGVKALLELAWRDGVRRPLFVHELYGNEINETERLEGFRHLAPALGMDGSDTTVDGPGELLAMAGRDGHDCVMFSRDIPALRFRAFAAAQGRKLAVTGFDNVSGSIAGLDQLSTVAVDCHAIGRVAADLLLETAARRRGFCVVRRVAGSLADRGSTQLS